MYNSIISYMERTSPETACEANTPSGRRMIRREAKEEIAMLMSAKESFELLGQKEAAKEALNKAVFAAKWLVKFGAFDAFGKETPQ